MSKSNNLTDFLTDLANTIRSVKNLSGTINPQNFSQEINSMLYIPSKGTALNSFSWNALQFISENGLALDYFSLGDTKTFQMGSETLTAMLVDTQYNGQSGMLFFCTGMATQYGMFNQAGGVADTTGGYGASALANTLNTTIFNNIEADLQNIIKECTVKYNLAGSSKNSNLSSANYKLFIPTGKEIKGNANYYNGSSSSAYYESWTLNDGEQFAYFKTNQNAALTGEKYLIRQVPYSQYCNYIAASGDVDAYRIWYSTASNICFMFMI